MCCVHELTNLGLTGKAVPRAELAPNQSRPVRGAKNTDEPRDARIEKSGMLYTISVAKIIHSILPLFSESTIGIS